MAARHLSFGVPPMRVFSESIESFLKKLNAMTREILRADFGVHVGRSRFRTADGWQWPIILVAIDDADRLGYFDPNDLTIGIHKRLMYTAKDRVLEDLLRHELAHYFAYIHFPDLAESERAHGGAFRSVCDRYGLGPEIRSASIEIATANDSIEGELGNEAVLTRFKRLMSLAESDNEHESSLAVLRANELMVKHNLDAARLQGIGDAGKNETEYCVLLVLEYKRSSPRRAAIAEILKEFLVYPVQTGAGLEVTGTRANVEQAEYIAGYLERALAAAWKQARRASPDRRLREKPFMNAAAAAYVQKLRASKSSLPKTDQRALVVLDKELAWAGHGVYGGNVHMTTTSYRTCGASTDQGTRAGRALEIHRGVGSQGVVPLLRS